LRVFFVERFKPRLICFMGFDFRGSRPIKPVGSARCFAELPKCSAPTKAETRGPDGRSDLTGPNEALAGQVAQGLKREDGFNLLTTKSGRPRLDQGFLVFFVFWLREINAVEDGECPAVSAQRNR